MARARTGLGRARGGALRLLVMGDTRVQAIRVSAGPAEWSAGVWEETVDESVGPADSGSRRGARLDAKRGQRLLGGVARQRMMYPWSLFVERRRISLHRS